MQNMQRKDSGEDRRLLTARQVQSMLHIDRSTVYRMAEDGRLSAIKVGRQWRFPADRIAALIDHDRPAVAQPVTGRAGLQRWVGGHPAPGIGTGVGLGSGPQPARWSVGEADAAAPGSSAAPALAPAAPDTSRPASSASDSGRVDTGFVRAAEAVLAVAGDLLGVMMVVTDMDGRPLTQVANPCDWFAERAEDPDVVSACSAEWQSMADDPDFAPRFRTGVLGFQCARAFIRSGSSLVGMVLAGGIAPTGSTTPGLYELSDEQRRRVISGLLRVAAALSRVPTREILPADPSPHPTDQGSTS